METAHSFSYPALITCGTTAQTALAHKVNRLVCVGELTVR